MHYDVFICHASEDKDDFVRPLAEMLEQQNISVWYDEFSLNLGDSLRQKIDEGLAHSEFGIVVLSPNFFKKPWTNRELNGLTTREILEQRDVILPIWHRVSVVEVARYSPPLADKVAVSSSTGINAVIRSLTKKIKPNPSPLVIAKEYLTGLGVETPPISDEWWLDMIEYKEVLRYPDTNSNMRWIFPLPFPGDDRGYDRGMNIASAALQSDWSFEGEELDIGPTTHPDEVYAFLQRWPGLYETARLHPDVLALYVPQITIPGFDKGFEEVFDKLMLSDRLDRIGGYGKSGTINDNDPLCPDIIALRHPTFGNYLPYELGRWYFDAHTLQYIRSSVELFDGLIWLLSPGANWMPAKHREMLIDGIISRDGWLRDIRPINSENRFLDIMYDDDREKFLLTPEVRHDLLILVITALGNLGVEADGEEVLERLLSTNFVARYFDFMEMIRERRKQRSIEK